MIDPGPTGVYWSGNRAKTGYSCFNTQSAPMTTTTTTTSATPTSIIALPYIRVLKTEDCGNQEIISTANTPSGTTQKRLYSSLHCEIFCVRTTFCQAYSFNASYASLNNNNYALYSISLSEVAISSSENSSIFFNSKSAGCYAVTDPPTRDYQPFTPKWGDIAIIQLGIVLSRGRQHMIPLCIWISRVSSSARWHALVIIITAWAGAGILLRVEVIIHVNVSGLVGSEYYPWGWWHLLEWWVV